MSSFQPNPLPEGYSMRLATEQDSERILDFSYSQPNHLISLFIILILLVWWQISISENKLKTICIIFAVSMLILILLNLYVAEVRSRFEGKSGSTYVVEYDNIICGSVTYLVFNRFAYIAGILVDINHRRRGLGSYMIQYCIDTIETPIYLQCCHELKTFYERLGFFRVGLFHAPSELSRFRSPNQYLMVTNELEIRRVG